MPHLCRVSPQTLDESDIEVDDLLGPRGGGDQLLPAGGGGGGRGPGAEIGLLSWGTPKEQLQTEAPTS